MNRRIKQQQQQQQQHTEGTKETIKHQKHQQHADTTGGTRTEYQEKGRGDIYNRTPEREDTQQKRREISRNRQESRNRQDQQRTRSPEFMYRDYRYKDTQQDVSRGRDRKWSPTRH